MQSPTNLRAFAYAKAVAVRTYALTARFPSEERFGITAQMRRAAVSVPANIAEGCGRNGNRALVNFLHIALGSLTELECLTDIAFELDMCSREQMRELEADIATTKAMLSRLIVALRQRPDVPSGAVESTVDG